MAEPAPQIEREIRAFIDWPKSYTRFNRISVIITAGQVVNQSGQPGKIIINHKD